MVVAVTFSRRAPGSRGSPTGSSTASARRHEVPSEFSERRWRIRRKTCCCGWRGSGRDRRRPGRRLAAVDQELRDVAAWPGDADRLAPIALPNGPVPTIPGVDRVYPVESAGSRWARSHPQAGERSVTPSDEKLIADLAGQAGLVLRNVRLNEELKVRFDELKAAQKRLVSAQDEGRRRLERNIHDGAQQQLVALAVKTRLARQLTERDPAKVLDILVQIEAETHQTLEDLRDLARGIYPPLLADKGLEAAIGSQAGRSAVPVTLHAALDGRFDRDVEAAVYFSVPEALQNVAKYADAHAVDVRLSRRDGELSSRWWMTAAGSIHPPSATAPGSVGIADRLGALDGSLPGDDAPGAGARLVGRLPSAPARRRTRRCARRRDRASGPGFPSPRRRVTCPAAPSAVTARDGRGCWSRCTCCRCP